MKKSFYYLITAALILVMTISFLLGICCGKEQKAKIVHVDFDYTKPEEKPEKEPKYAFLDAEMSNYIEKLSGELGIDSDLAVAHLLVENPELNWNAIHHNENGTLDLGGFQLNDKYIYLSFLPAYWDMDIDFDPFNPKQNTFLALHHIRYLNEKLKVQEDAIAAYNCGIGAVMNNQIPEITKIYTKRVINTYKLLKASEDKNG